MEMMLPILSILYTLIVAGDVWITIKAVNLGIAKEANIILIPFVHHPFALIIIEVLLCAIVISGVVCLYNYSLTRTMSLVILSFAVLFRGLILAHNFIVARGK